MADWIELLWVLLLLIVCVACWFGTMLTLPGNWGIVLAAAGYAAFAPGAAARQVSWWTVLGLGLLALVGEAIEALAGAAGTARAGGSRRGMVLSLLGAAVGSIGGAVAGLPIPVIGSAVAAVMGGAIGAFGGAILGELWKGRATHQQLEVGRAAFLGRLFGTMGKLVVGAIMIVIAVVDAIW